MNTNQVTNMKNVFGPQGEDGVTGVNGPKGAAAVAGISDDAMERIRHMTELVKEFEGISLWERIMNNKKYNKLKDQINNHKENFPEYYL